VVIPAIPVDADDDGTSAPYTAESVAMAKRIHAALKERLPCAQMPVTSTHWLDGDSTDPMGNDAMDQIAARALKQEIHSYLQRVTSTGGTATDVDPLEWWQAMAPDLPCLAEFARRYLAVPATTAESERLFSLAGAVVSPMRTRLDPGRVNQLVSTRAYYLAVLRERREEVAADASEAGERINGMLEEGDVAVDDDGYLEPVQNEGEVEVNCGTAAI
jgi:hypothetical protein